MSKRRWRRIFPVILVCLAYFALFSTLDLLRHFSYSQNSNDVAAFDQSLWFFGGHEGHGFYNSIEGVNHFAVHFSPIFFLTLPIYAIFPSPVTLILCQCLACASGIFFVFLIARRVLNARLGLFFATLFALYHPLHGVTWDILNELSYVIAPLLMAFYGLIARKASFLWIGCILALACKEEIGLVIGFFGIFVTVTGLGQSSKKLAIHGILLSLLGFGTTFFVLHTLIPYVRGGPYQYFTDENRYREFGSSITQILFHVMTNPFHVLQVAFTFPKIMYCIELLAPLAFVSLLAPGSLWMAIPTLAANLLSNASMMSMVGARYPAAIIPFVFTSAIYGTKKLLERSKNPLKLQLTFTLICTLLFNSTPLRIGFRIPKITPHCALVRRVINTIPAGSVVATQPNFTAHFAHGCIVSPFYRNDAEWVLLDLTYPQWYRDSKMTPDEISKRGFIIVEHQEGLLLYKAKLKSRS